MVRMRQVTDIHVFYKRMKQIQQNYLGKTEECYKIVVDLINKSMKIPKNLGKVRKGGKIVGAAGMKTFQKAYFTRVRKRIITTNVYLKYAPKKQYRMVQDILLKNPLHLTKAQKTRLDNFFDSVSIPELEEAYICYGQLFHLAECKRKKSIITYLTNLKKSPWMGKTMWAMIKTLKNRKKEIAHFTN